MAWISAVKPLYTSSHWLRGVLGQTFYRSKIRPWGALLSIFWGQGFLALHFLLKLIPTIPHFAKWIEEWSKGRQILVFGGAHRSVPDGPNSQHTPAPTSVALHHGIIEFYGSYRWHIVQKDYVTVNTPKKQFWQERILHLGIDFREVSPIDWLTYFSNRLKLKELKKKMIAIK